jgi:hypothetical protein
MSVKLELNGIVYDASIDKWFYDTRIDEADAKYMYDICDAIRGACGKPESKAKDDDGKPKVSLVPPQIIYDIAEVREYGNKKYPEGGKNNWKYVDIQRYRDALGRHVLAYLEDPEGVDKESGIKHYKHIACNIAFICYMEQHIPLMRKVNDHDIPDCITTLYND